MSKTIPEYSGPKPAEMMISNGSIKMLNGAPSGEYLRDFQMKRGVQNETPVIVITEASYRSLVAAAEIPRIA